MLYEIHMIKNYPPTNLNRDETGSPKSCYFGGSQRGRISSQCLKRAWRTSPLFVDLLGSKGIRTRKLPELVAAELKRRGMDEALIAVAEKKVTGIANKDGKENNDSITSQIIFYSDADISAVADIMEKSAAEAGDLKSFEKMKASDIVKQMKNVEIRPITMDIALFGRMVTSDAFADVEAAVQAAHAISTHAVNQESDYFTAVDDMISSAESDDAGAGMIGDTDFNSCCYYHYMAIDTDILEKNLRYSPDAEVLIREVLPAMIQVMAYSDPSGKQNSFAGHVLPDMLCVEVKEKKIPVNYANAFAEPVRFAGQQKLVSESIRKLVEEIDTMDQAYGLGIVHRGWFSPRTPELVPKKCDGMKTFESLLEACSDWAER